MGLRILIHGINFSPELTGIGKYTVGLVFCGEGPGLAMLEAACGSFSRVRFLDLQPLARLPDLLCLADIHLLPQRADAADLVMPSKLTGMLATGRAPWWRALMRGLRWLRWCRRVVWWWPRKMGGDGKGRSPSGRRRR